MPKDKTKAGAGTGKNKPATANKPAPGNKRADVYRLQYADGFIKLCAEGYEIATKETAQLFTEKEAHQHASALPGAKVVVWEK